MGRQSLKTILHIITGLNDGGAEAVLYRLCTADRCHKHHVVSLMDCGKYGPMLEAAGIPVTTIGLPRGKVTVAGFRNLRCAIRDLHPDAVQTWMYHADLLGGLAARLAGVRNVTWGIHHTTLDPKQSPRSTILVAKVCALLSRWIPRRIVCCAEASREIHAELGYDVVRMRVIPNGYDLSVFQPDLTAGANLRRDLGLAADALVIGFVARFDPLKDHHTLLQALALLRGRGIAPICLLIGTGLGPENQQLAAWIAETVPGDQIRLLGRRDDIPAMMNALDLHVMSSYSEAFPNVLAEAMACGTPCVSTDVGDARAIVGATGRIVPPRDPAALAMAIAEMLAAQAAPDWAVRRAAARIHVAENFSLERMVDAYHRVWTEPVLANRKS
jgi:glycosyltransferase involved in cell wall biosynthesis